MFEKILVPMDDSESSYHVLKKAMENFKDSEIVVLNVIESEKYRPKPRFMGEVTERYEETLTRIAERIITKARKLAEEKGVKIKTIAEEGEAASTIVSVAEKIGAKAILMATRSTPTEKFILGSVTEKVIKQVPRDVPVFVWRGVK